MYSEFHSLFVFKSTIFSYECKMPFTLRFRERAEHDLRTLALTCALHQRLGADSVLRVLNGDLLQQIAAQWSYPAVTRIFARNSPDGLPSGECVHRSMPGKKSKYSFRLMLRTGVVVTEGVLPFNGWLHYTSPEDGECRLVIIFTHHPEGEDDETPEEYVRIEAWKNDTEITQIHSQSVLSGETSFTLMGVLDLAVFVH